MTRCIAHVIRNGRVIGYCGFDQTQDALGPKVFRAPDDVWQADDLSAVCDCEGSEVAVQFWTIRRSMSISWEGAVCIACRAITKCADPFSLNRPGELESGHPILNAFTEQIANVDPAEIRAIADAVQESGIGGPVLAMLRAMGGPSDC